MNRILVLSSLAAVVVACGRAPSVEAPIDATPPPAAIDDGVDDPVVGPSTDEPAAPREVPVGDTKPEEDPREEPTAPPADDGCAADAHEPNDAQAQARVVAAGATVQGEACAGEQDWFAVQVGAGCALTVTASFAHADGDLDLALFGPDGEELVTSAGVADDETVTYDVAAAGRYAARVAGYGEAQNAYALATHVECAAAPPPASGCPDDVDADDPASAAPIGASSGGAACTGDRDWFSVDVAAGCTVKATLSFAHAAGDLDLVIEDAAGARLDSSAGYADVEEVEATFAAAGQAKIGVLGYGADANTYALSVAKTCAAPPLSCPADDGWEPNDTAYGALEVFDGETVSGIVCGGDVDVWALWVPQDCAAVVELGFKHGEGDLDMSFYAPSGAHMDTSARATDGERIVEVATGSGEHFVAVGGYAGAENTYDLTASTVCREDLACPSDDPYEPNDDRGASVRLDGVDTAIGTTCGDDDWYYVDAQPGCTVEAALYFDHEEGDLDLEIVDGADDVVGSSSSTADVEIADTYVWVAGRIAVRVKPYGGASARYLLDTFVTCP